MIDHKSMMLSLLIPLGVAVSLPAAAQDVTGPGAEMFAQLDTDGDGALSLEELQARADGSGRFETADANGDGALSREEMLAAATERAEAGVDRFFDRFDSDGDGSVTQAEMAAVRDAAENDRRAQFAERIFNRMDRDDDGLISAEEFEAARARMGERGEGRGGFFGDRG